MMGVNHTVEEKDVREGVLEPSSAKMSRSIELDNHLLRIIMWVEVCKLPPYSVKVLL